MEEGVTLDPTKKKKILCDYLPEEIFTQILERLPVKSLLVCRCVQKSWYYLIQSPLFITAHLNYQRAHHKYLLLESAIGLLSLRFDDVQCEEYYLLKLCPSLRCLPLWYGVSEGLMCFVTDIFSYSAKVYLWNPAIRKLKTLPDPPRASIPGCFTSGVLAFGFCPKANDFKVVKIFNRRLYVDDNHFLAVCSKFTVADIYSLNTNSWRTIDNNLINVNSVSRDDWVFLNGTAYFRAESLTSREDIIVCYDTDKDIMREISLPESCSVRNAYLHHSLQVYGKTIALFMKTSCLSGFNMWVLKGGEDHWEKKISFNLHTNSKWNWNVIGMRNNGEVVVYNEFEYGLMSYDVKNKEAKVFVDSWNDRSFLDEVRLAWRPPAFRANLFTESLVLIDD